MSGNICHRLIRRQLIVENERSGVNKGAICSIKISQDVRDFAAAWGITEEETLAKGIEVRSVEFVRQEAEVYHEARLILSRHRFVHD